LPGLLFRNIATSNLYDADYSIIFASLVFKFVSGVFIFAYCYFTRACFGPAPERSLVMHSVLTFPNYVVIGTPVLSAIFNPAVVKTMMSLLLMEQVSLHLTYVAVIAEVFCVKAPPPSVGEHAHGAMHLHGAPTRTDAHGWALGVVGSVLSRTGNGVEGVDGGALGGGTGWASGARVSSVEMKPRLSLSRTASQERSALLLAEAAALPAEQHSHDLETPAAAESGAVGHAMPEHANHALRVLRIVRDRLLTNPMVIGAFAGVITSLAVKAKDHTRPLPYILDTTSLYLQNCVLGISLFNFGLFAFCHGIISCGYQRAAVIVLMRCVVSPLCCLLVMLVFRLKGDVLKIMILQGALPQAVSSFVVFKEFKIQPEVFSTSTTLTTALCLPTMLIWYVMLSSV